MPANAERQLARLHARFHSTARQLDDIGFVLRGSVIQRFSRCGSAGCHCHDEPPRLHGPYWQWSAKVKAKTTSRMLTDTQAHRYQQWIENGRRLDEIVTELYDLSAQADALLRTLERSASDTNEKNRQQQKEKARRRRAPT